MLQLSALISDLINTLGSLQGKLSRPSLYSKRGRPSLFHNKNLNDAPKHPLHIYSGRLFSPSLTIYVYIYVYLCLYSYSQHSRSTFTLQLLAAQFQRQYPYT